MEEEIQTNDYNPFNKKQNETIQEDQEDTEIPGLNEISYTESTASNVIW